MSVFFLHFLAGATRSGRDNRSACNYFHIVDKVRSSVFQWLSGARTTRPPLCPRTSSSSSFSSSSSLLPHSFFSSFLLALFTFPFLPCLSLNSSLSYECARTHTHTHACVQVRKRPASTGPGAALSCWGLFVDGNEGPELHYGANDFFPTLSTLSHTTSAPLHKQVVPPSPTLSPTDPVPRAY